MKLSGFPMCCGANIISNLYVNPYYYCGDERKRSKINFIKKISNLISSSYGHRKGLILAITNSDQREAVNIMKKFGFKLLKRFYNPNTHSMLRLWELNLNRTTIEQTDKIELKLIKQIV